MSAVTLRIYDLSQGMARQMSPAILGKRIDGIWHTGVQVFDREYYFGGGICSDPPGMTPYGTPHSIHPMGQTQKTKQQFVNFLSQVSPNFSMTSYHLLDNNCNNFSDAVCVFLLDQHIPQHILDLPSEALNSPLGAIIRPLIDQMQSAITQQSMGHQVQLPAASNPSTSNASTSNPSTTRASPQSNSNPETYWKAPVLLGKANRQAIRTKLNQQRSDLFPLEGPPHRDSLIEYALTVSDLQLAFPALDYLRLLALDEAEAHHIVPKVNDIAQCFIRSEQPPPVPCMMALRIFVNLFKHHGTTKILCEEPTVGALIEAACSSLEMNHPSVRKTAAILLLNFAGASSRHLDIAPPSEEHVVRLTYASVARLNNDNAPKPEEATPLLQTVSLLLDTHPDTKMLLSAFELNLDRFQDAESCTDRDMREAAARVAKTLS